MQKNRIWGVLALTLLLAWALCLPAGAFSEEPSSWAAESCARLEEAGVLTWDLYTGSTSPSSAIRRGDFCQLLVNLVQMEGDWEKIARVDPMPDGYFTDVPSAGSASGMYYGAAYGIVDGSVQDGRRVADAYGVLTREQAAKMMCALIDALETYGGVPAPQPGEAMTFADQSAVAGWAAEYVARASALGILQGDGKGNFNPKGSLTWQEACVMADRVYTAAETAVKARREAAGIRLLDTAFEQNAEKYIREGDRLYVLENSGQYSILRIGSGSVEVETYRADGSSAGIRAVPMELEMCGAFCEDENHYYLAFGAQNMEENAGKSVYRVVKYDKNWNRLGAADVSDCYTTIPFYFTSHTAMAADNGVLVLHTARQRYLTRDDGLRHQSNFTVKIRTPDMTVAYQSDTFDENNYTSHSFAQYVAFDGGLPVYADQGDAYPRGFALSVESPRGLAGQQNFFPFAGALGDNTTNAVPGGLGVSSSHYLFAGASSPQQGGDSLKKANAFLSVIPKSGGQAQTRWLTSLPAGGGAYVNNIRLVEVDANTFVVMWQVARDGSRYYQYDDFQYAVFDGQGNQVGETRSMPGYIVPAAGSDPSVYGGRILWARPELDSSQRSSVRPNRYMQIFELNVAVNAPSSNVTTPSAGSQTPEITAQPSASLPTTVCEVNGLSITRTDVPDQGTTSCYREEWDGNWMEVSVSGNEFAFSGCFQESYYSQAILSITTSPSILITPGEPFRIAVQTDAAELANGRNISAGVTAAGGSVWVTFHSGVSLKAVLDGNGDPAIQVSLPFWLR